LRIALASERFDDVATAWKRIARELNPRVKPEPRSQNFTEAFRLVTPEFDIVDPVSARGASVSHAMELGPALKRSESAA
jgi:hypothetical protein